MRLRPHGGWGGGVGSAAKFYPGKLRLEVLFSFRFENNIPAGKAKGKAVAAKRECMRTAKIGPDLRLP